MLPCELYISLFEPGARVFGRNEEKQVRCAPSLTPASTLSLLGSPQAGVDGLCPRGASGACFPHAFHLQRPRHHPRCGKRQWPQAEHSPLPRAHGPGGKGWPVGGSPGAAGPSVCGCCCRPEVRGGSPRSTWKMHAPGMRPPGAPHPAGRMPGCPRCQCDWAAPRSLSWWSKQVSGILWSAAAAACDHRTQIPRST